MDTSKIRNFFTVFNFRRVFFSLLLSECIWGAATVITAFPPYSPLNCIAIPGGGSPLKTPEHCQLHEPILPPDCIFKKRLGPGP